MPTPPFTTLPIATIALDSASVTATNSTISRTLANRFADVVNVKDSGATGNGVTDDTAAIQTAINGANSNSTYSVYFPPGIYLVGNLTLPSNVGLYGPQTYGRGGYNGAILKSNGATGYMISMPNGTTFWSSVNGLHLQGTGTGVS